MDAPRKADIRLDIAPDRNALHIEFGKDDRKLVGFTLEAPELDRLIALLGTARAALAEQVPARLDPGARIPATVAPAWHVSETGTAGAEGVMLRHPGFGWLGFALPRHEMRALAAALAGADAIGTLNAAPRR